MVLITIVTGAFVNQLITGGPHIVHIYDPQYEDFHHDFHEVQISRSHLRCPVLVMQSAPKTPEVLEDFQGHVE